MIKKILLSIAVVFSAMQADEGSSIEFRVSAFIPDSSRFKAVYEEAIPLFQLEANTMWLPQWGSWVSAGWLSEQGVSTGCSKTHTTVQIASLGLGFKNIYQLTEGTAGYWGLGAAFAEIYVKNKSKQSSNAFTGGVMWKSGFNIDLHRNLYLDFFFDYSYYAPVFDTHINIGGLQFGAGIGNRF